MVSLEALAMAGVGWDEYGKSVEEWEREDLDAQPPDYLLADDREEVNEHDFNDYDQVVKVHDDQTIMQCVAEVGKLFKVADDQYGLADDVLESFDGRWISERGCLGVVKMEVKLKFERIIRTFERLK